MSTADTGWDMDWDDHTIDSSAPRAQVDPFAGELRPVAVDESLTDLLFAGRPVASLAVAAPAPPADDTTTWAGSEAALFGMV